jgi:hypothetical protein
MYCGKIVSMIAILLFLSIFMMSCTVENLIIHDANIRAASPNIPVHIVKNGDSTRLELSSSLSINDDKKININNEYKIEKGELTIRNNIIDAHLDYIIDNKIAIFTGLEFAKSDDKFLPGIMLGFGFIKKYSNCALRFDVGAAYKANDAELRYSYLTNWNFPNGEARVYDSSFGNVNYLPDIFTAVTFNTLHLNDKFDLFVRMVYYSRSNMSLLQFGILDGEGTSVILDNLMLGGGFSFNLGNGFYSILGFDYNLVFTDMRRSPYTHLKPFISVNYNIK